ncbi:PAS domain-containing protein [Flavobacterium sp.]|uniref:PAS domain-containing protein n=1 Tax=Flavobacterium sp. TaxID=239 RepID=UPI002625D276|nr:PAS domain-containing protein [Flavobacterium sp.]MDD3003392.1 PAS domain-containing protein [Flavobacterium sp.]
MPNLNLYNESLKNADSKNKSIIMPLISWDIYSNYFQEVKAQNADFSQLIDLKALYNWDLKFNLLDELQNNDTILITNRELKIEFASQGVLAMTGYLPDEVIGKSPKMFQGEKTSKEKRNMIKEAVLAQKPFETVMVNYRKNGETYDCHIRSFPIFNTKGELSHFIALEKAA